MTNPSAEDGKKRRLTAVMRDGAKVTALELFFDLVFVLALTQCTALMATNPTWEGLAQGIFVLAVLWWSWVGYAWLTSVINPEEGIVRIVFFAAMAAFLVAALCVPGVFGNLSLLFAGAYAVVRLMHICLFLLASRGDAALRKSVWGLAGSTALGVGLLFLAAATDGHVQLALWGLAVVVDMVGPFLFGADGWKIEPSHFAERHGLIVIIALGESIVALGVGSSAGVDVGVVAAAVVGITIVAALWWLYFDVVAIVAERHLSEAEVGRKQNEIARDSYSYIHFPMIAGVVLIALAMKKTLGHVGDPLKLVPTAALFGGSAMYLLAHVAFRLRNIRTLNKQRLIVAVCLLCSIPLATLLPALAALLFVAVFLCGLIAYEAIRFSAARDRIRHL